MDHQKEIENYILSHIDDEDDVLHELDRETHLKVRGSRMLSGHLQGKLLTMLSQMIRPSLILEIGTFTGYSAICLAKGLAEHGKLITIEKDDELQYLANKYFNKAGFGHQIEQRTGRAKEILPTINEQFELVFIDADKREYSEYYRLVFDKVKDGGFIIADNTLWSGKVLEKITHEDTQTKGIEEFNTMIKHDQRIEKMILPFRDGLTIIRKKLFSSG